MRSALKIAAAHIESERLAISSWGGLTGEGLDPARLSWVPSNRLLRLAGPVFTV